MSLKIIIIDAALIVLCITPFVWLAMKRKNKKQGLLLKIIALADKGQHKITVNDYWDTTAIGLDKQAGVLFFYRKKNEQEHTDTIQLSDIQSCRKVETGHTVGSKGSSVRVLDKLELELVPQSKQKEIHLLEFYDSEVSSILGDELQMIEKWVDLVNQQISSLQNNKRKAG